jgi:hypothetical protein
MGHSGAMWDIFRTLSNLERLALSYVEGPALSYVEGPALSYVEGTDIDDTTPRRDRASGVSVNAAHD